jgi:hypothetical protein
MLRNYEVDGTEDSDWPSHENGYIEQRQYGFKQAVDQALMMRGSRDFVMVNAYDQSLRKLFARMNAGRRERLAEELLQLQPLPKRRLDSTRCPILRKVERSGFEAGAGSSGLDRN